jgi:hypothetical protein
MTTDCRWLLVPAGNTGVEASPPIVIGLRMYTKGVPTGRQLRSSPGSVLAFHCMIVYV